MKPTDPQITALNRLWKIANGHSGQCNVIAKFLLGLYNGLRFPFDLTELRSIDDALLTDCIAVLEMDARNCYAEVHVLLNVPSDVFETLAKDWRIKEQPKRRKQN